MTGCSELSELGSGGSKAGSALALRDTCVSYGG